MKANKKQLALISVFGLATATSLSLGLIGNINHIHNAITNYPQKLSERMTESQIDTSEYQSTIQKKRDELYDKLNKGEITIDQFRHAYTNLTKDYSLEDWAREQKENTQLQEIITEYESDIRKYHESADNATDLVLAGVAGIGLTTSTAFGSYAYWKYKKFQEEKQQYLEKKKSHKQLSTHNNTQGTHYYHILEEGCYDLNNMVKEKPQPCKEQEMGK